MLYINWISLPGIANAKVQTVSLEKLKAIRFNLIRSIYGLLKMNNSTLSQVLVLYRKYLQKGNCHCFDASNNFWLLFFSSTICLSAGFARTSSTVINLAVNDFELFSELQLNFFHCRWIFTHLVLGLFCGKCLWAFPWCTHVFNFQYKEWRQ